MARNRKRKLEAPQRTTVNEDVTQELEKEQEADELFNVINSDYDSESEEESVHEDSDESEYDSSLDSENDFTQENSSSCEESETTEEVPQHDKKKLLEYSKAGSNMEIKNKTPDEYEFDSSDEEDIRNTIGNVPKVWYDDYGHLGYDWDGKKLIKPATGDQLDEFLKRMEDPDFWRTVKDPQTGQNVVLTDEEIQIIKRIRAGKIPDLSFDDHAPWVEWFTSEVMETPLRNFPESKKSFLPSKHEARMVSELVHKLKMGQIKTRAEAAQLRAKKDTQFYLLWKTDDQADEMRRIHKHIPAPKRLLPGHAESYNPPPEFLFDEREMKQWNKLKDTPWKRKLHFVPQKHDSLRKVPAYPRFIKERNNRCLDLYLCPRAIKNKINIEPEALVPKLPSSKDLQPFPNKLTAKFTGHTDMVRTISINRDGRFLLSGSDDGTVKVWEVMTGRCLKTIDTGDIVRSVDWCLNKALSLVLVASGKRVLIINPLVGDPLVCSKTDSVLHESQHLESVMTERERTAVQWSVPEQELSERGIRIILTHFKEVGQVTWHGRGDYFATVVLEGQNRSVLISQISKRQSQVSLCKSHGAVQCVLFHPTKPCLFVATQSHVRIYDLVKQNLVKKLMTNCKWISSMAIHPWGDNLLVATYDRKVLWFDLDLSTKPYQTLRLHGTAVRGVAFHKRYPLFASGSDDRSLIICHGTVYNELDKNPLIVPLKRIESHKPHNDFGIFGVIFHSMQPWVFSSGADGAINLFYNE